VACSTSARSASVPRQVEAHAPAARRDRARLPALAEFNRLDSVETPALVAEGIACVLGNWPKGFHDFLAAIVREGKVKTTAFRKRYESLYTRFFKCEGESEDFGWLREEFVQYGLKHASDAVVDSKLLGGRSDQRLFISKSALARLLGVSPVTLRKWAEAGSIELHHVDGDKVTRYVADRTSEDYQIAASRVGRVMSPREAAIDAIYGLPLALARQLNIPTPTLDLLVGLVEVDPLAWRRFGYEAIGADESEESSAVVG
jgi:hypothetical protein